MAFLFLLLFILYRGWKQGVITSFISSLNISLFLYMILLFLLFLPMDGLISVGRAKGSLIYLSKIGNMVGDADVVLPVLIVLSLFFLSIRRDREEALLVELICLIVLIALLGNIMKVLVGRARPYLGLGSLSFFNLPDSLFSNDFQSFPSGHVLVASSLLSFLHLRFRRFFYFAFLLVVIVAYNRLESHNHFLSDVAFSGAMGYIAILNYMKKGVTMPEGFNLSIISDLPPLRLFKRLFSR